MIFITFFFSSCLKAQTSDIVGYYSSNFAVSGFFIQRVELKGDGTFKYERSGDMQYQMGKGTYSVNNDTIYFTYLPTKYDTVTYKKVKYVLNAEEPPKFFLDTVEITELDSSSFGHRPYKLLFKQSELHFISDSGKEDITWPFLRRRKFIFYYGKPYWTERVYYLEKRDKSQFS